MSIQLSSRGAKACSTLAMAISAAIGSGASYGANRSMGTNVPLNSERPGIARDAQLGTRLDSQFALTDSDPECTPDLASQSLVAIKPAVKLVGFSQRELASVDRIPSVINQKPVGIGDRPKTRDDSAVRQVTVAGSIVSMNASSKNAAIVVNSSSSSNDGSCDATHCSLIEAAELAIQREGADRIIFRSTLAGSTIELEEPIPFNDNLSIEGLGAENLTLGGSSSEFFAVAIPKSRIERPELSVSRVSIERPLMLVGNTLRERHLLSLRQVKAPDPLQLSSYYYTQFDGTTIVGTTNFVTVHESTLGDVVMQPGNSGELKIFSSTVGSVTAKETNAEVRNSTLTGNLVAVMDEYSNGGTSFAIFGSTIDGNVYTECRGEYEIYCNDMRFTNSIVTGNIVRSSLPKLTVSLRHTLVQGDILEDRPGAPDEPGEFTDRGGNLIGVSAELKPLADNGGQSMTFGLAPTSPAIDAGYAPECEVEDQRGFRRDASCDMGAFEAGATGLQPALPIPATNRFFSLALTFLVAVLALARGRSLTGRLGFRKQPRK